MENVGTTIPNNLTDRRMNDSFDRIIAHVRRLIADHAIKAAEGFGDRNCTGWVYTRHAHVFIRAGRTYVEGMKLDVIELGSISVPEEYQKRGFATRILNHMEMIADETSRVLRIECILNEDWYRSLSNRPGYAIHAGHLSTLYRYPRRTTPVEMTPLAIPPTPEKSVHPRDLGRYRA